MGLKFLEQLFFKHKNKYSRLFKIKFLKKFPETDIFEDSRFDTDNFKDLNYVVIC